MANTLKKPNRRGLHPNSQKNLIHTGRPRSDQRYGEPTGNRSLTLTQTAWNNVRKLAKDAGYSSLSEFLELLGRGVIPMPHKPDVPADLFDFSGNKQ